MTEWNTKTGHKNNYCDMKSKQLETDHPYHTPDTLQFPIYNYFQNQNEENLIGDELLDSFDIISIVSAIDNEFDVKITAKDILPENFNSASALYELIQRLEEE